VAVDHLLQVDAADAFERSDKEGIHGDQITAMTGFDVPFSESGTELFQNSDVLVRQLETAFGTPAPDAAAIAVLSSGYSCSTRPAS
jgi:hypothetical protein